ncbi:uncharacterized protein LOC135491668 [Lineus longissimus]|uniref:uncharacterized protein LOC135491668 n=1 Tax=Lineus longissimus TaxID=88925 RepID=UPI002B4F95A7
MADIYKVSGTENLKALERELGKELQELKNEIEENEMVHGLPARTISSLPLPKDVEHFRRERKVVLDRALMISEAHPTVIQADVMKEELLNCERPEYTADNMPLLLLQHFSERIYQLVQCKHMHMLRWKRFCEHSSTIESLYPAYQKRLADIMTEYHDCLSRTQRLSVAREAHLAGMNNASPAVKMDDLLIYLRWLICHLHAIKKFNQFARVLQWFPVTHKTDVTPTLPDAKEQDDDAPTTSRFTSRYQDDTASFLSRPASGRSRPSSGASLHSPSPVPNPPSGLSHTQLLSAQVGPMSSAPMLYAAAAAGGGIASDEQNLGLPLHVNDFDSIKVHLNVFVNMYGLSTDVESMKSTADEMELYAAVNRKFKQIFVRQETMKTFKTYDRIESGQENWGADHSTHALKQDANWLSFVKLLPEKDPHQERQFLQLRQRNNVDELLRVMSRFLQVHDPERIQDTLREHAISVREPPSVTPVYVTSNRTGNNTKLIWKKIYTNPELFTLQDQNQDIQLMEIEEKDTDNVNLSRSRTSSAKKRKDSYDYSTTVQMLGLDDGDQDSSDVASLQGAYLSFLHLRHLRIRDLQRTCLSILNYFRSVERTMTINDGGLSLDGCRLKRTSAQNHRKSATELGGVGGGGGLGSHHYLHYNPRDYRMSEAEFMHFSEVENHDDFYTSDEGRVHVQDQRGYYMMYDAALEDLKALEQDLLLLATHYIEKDKDMRTASRINRAASSSSRMKKSSAGDFDIPSYGHQEVDRFGILLDLWTNEAAYLECKKGLLDCYVEAYLHVFDRDEKRGVAQVMTNIMYKRPRFDFSASYFLKSYRMECICLRLHSTLIKNILDNQIEDQREYIHKVTRDAHDSDYGLPHKVIAKQPISINISRPALRNIFLLEFHPSLSIASRLPDALKHAYWELYHLHKPETTSEAVHLEKRMLEVALKEWDKMDTLGASYSHQMQKDLFQGMYVEDPQLLVEIAHTLVHEEEQTGRRRTQKEKHTDILNSICRVMEMVTLRHRLLDSAWETEVLSKIYRKQAVDMGYDECHLFLRFVQFEYANFKENAGKPPPVFITAIQEDDTSVDKYTPSNLYLAINELDESHVGKFSFKSREGILQVLKCLGSLQTILMAQVVHKNALVSAVLQGHGCQPIKPTFIDAKTSGRLSPSETKSEKSSLTAMTGLSSGTQGTMLASKLQTGTPMARKSPEAFVSLQLEKNPSRDLMLNDFVNKKSSMSMILKNPEEMEKLKRKLIGEYCHKFMVRVSQYSLRAQIIAYYNSILGLLEQFPSIRENYFLLGELNEKKSENDDVLGLTPDARSLKKRPRRLLSPDGKHVLNIWFIPHYSEILIMFKTMEDDTCNRALRYCSLIVAALHDILQYLCAHAKLGSANARLGKKEGVVAADWGGTEGIGADLRELQKQINHLPFSTSPDQVAELLTLRRDVMLLEFDTSVRLSMRNTFLQMGNIQAYKAITNNIFTALPALSNVISPSVLATGLSIPEPLEPKDHKAKELYPWRTFINNQGPFPVTYWQWQQIEYYIQLCLSGLKEVDRSVANGEILGVTLLMEDVLNSGYLDTATLSLESEDEEGGSRHPSRPTSRMSRIGGSRKSSLLPASESSYVKEPVVEKKTLSQQTQPIESYKLLHVFLLLWRRLEMMKAAWGRRKLGVEDIDTVSAFREYTILYKVEKLFPCLKSIAARHGRADFYDGMAADSETLSPPPGASEIEIKTKQLVKLCESLEVFMITEVRRKLLRELNLVLAERAREESALPTDLWKKPAMKESYTINKPHIAEDFKDLLMAEVQEEEDGTLVFTKKHLNTCLQQLARDVMERERHNYESYAMYYENLLRSQHQLLYQKEQEVKQVRDQLNTSRNDTMVDVQCLLADQSHELLLEITALRAKIAEMREISLTQERDIRERVKEEYDDLIRNLFSSAFELKSRFDEFRHELHDDCFDKISEARREAIEAMTRLKQKSGGSDKDDEVTARLLSMSEQIRETKHENYTLGKLMLKMKSMTNWRQNHMQENFFKQVAELKKESDHSKKEYLGVKMMAEEEVILYRQQQVALRKYLQEAERELLEVKKLMDKEIKNKKEKMHTAQQKAQSLKQLEMARAANAEKLLEELEEKELRLKVMEEEQEKHVRLKQLTEEKARKDVSQVKKHLNHERHLKLDAFNRCDELQTTLYDFELAASRPETAMMILPSPNRPKSRVSSAGVARKSTGRLSTSHSSTGIWPPPVSFPVSRSMTPAPEGIGKQLAVDWKKREQVMRPKTVHGQLRSKIAEQLLTNLEPDTHQTMITLQTLQL